MAGTGRRGGLKIRFPTGSEGSNPSTATYLAPACKRETRQAADARCRADGHLSALAGDGGTFRLRGSLRHATRATSETGRPSPAHTGRPALVPPPNPHPRRRYAFPHRPHPRGSTHHLPPPLTLGTTRTLVDLHNRPTTKTDNDPERCYEHRPGLTNRSAQEADDGYH